ncbi:MAG: Zn-ribbon domain-containing protein [Halobacteriaceae archaeon]
MPHQCTNCGHIFPDGSKEMLSGCPECGGNKFQFLPEGVSDETELSTEPQSPDRDQSMTERVGRAAASVKDLVGSDEERTNQSMEDTAQSEARSEVVDDHPPRSSGNVKEVQEPTGDESPDLSSLREELNDQFESIRIIEPGQYELNLMELYNREEYIIALQENGRYMIEVPDTWKDSDS